MRFTYLLIVLALLLACRGAARSDEPVPTRMVNETDGTVLLLVPAGSFAMGSPPQIARRAWDEVQGEMTLPQVMVETPRHDVVLPAFYMARTEVTCAQFRRFVEATKYDAGHDWQQYAKKWGETTPVVDVSWNDAQAYCAWAGLRLPSEEEWEKAARGTDGRDWPWGNNFDVSRCRCSVGDNYKGAHWPVPVGSYESGASPFGCMDMAGNAAEWTASPLKPYPGNQEKYEGYAQNLRVVRGGSWRDNTNVYLRCADRWWNSPDQRNSGLGFRCAR